MANPENLQPWKPGQSGNPGGSSKKQRLTAALVRILDERGLDDAFARVGMARALKGDFRYWKYIFERIDGPAAGGGAVTLDDIVSGLLNEIEDPPDSGPLSE